MIDYEHCCGATDVGRKRENNQDAFLVGRLSKSMVVGANSLSIQPQTRLFGDDCGWLMLVADGMGGHAGGERASSLAIQYLVERLLNNVHWFLHLNVEAEQEFVGDLKKLLCDTHHAIQSEGRKDIALSGMGTTLTMTYLVWPTLYVLHAGDSRCYLIRDGQAIRLTTDHTLARRMVESGGLRPEDESASRWSNVLWNVLGGKSEEQLKAEVRQVTLQHGDTLVLCSDGLHRYTTDDKIVDVLNNSESCKEACQMFIDLANARGGDDNITVIVAQTPQDARFDPLATTDSNLGQSVESEIFDTTHVEQSLEDN
jgi:serine/threonine protein phosphatase PrpC